MLVVPDCIVKKARMTISGNDVNGQAYFIDGKEVAVCHTTYHNDDCGVSPIDITDKIPTGLHSISAGSIQWEHIMWIEAITSPIPPKKFVLYGPNFRPWINETGNSKTLSDMISLIMGNTTNVCDIQLPGDILVIDSTSSPKIRVNVFVNTTCAKSGSLKKEDFKIKENNTDIAIDNAYFSGNASGKNLDLAVVFDDTGSMQPQIDAMKSKVQGLTDLIKSSGMDARYALVTFNDGVVVRVEWTSDPKSFNNSVNSLKATRGGDAPEVALDAIEKVLSMGFSRPDAQKVILVITDAPAHHKGDGTTYSMYTKDEVLKDLKDSGVILIPVSPTFENSTEYVDLRKVADEIQSMWIDMNSADFSTILEEFKTIITGTYVLEYTSPDLTPDTNRDVVVNVDKPGCADGCTSASYTAKA
jgi:Mg-chelatase subunit ChlD